MSDFKVGDRIYCFVTLSTISSPNNDGILISPGIYTVSEIKKYSSGVVYTLKEFEESRHFNRFHNSYFISIAEARKIKLNKINENKF